MYAIVRIGGKQYHAEIGSTIVVEKLPYDVGQQLEFDQILLLSDGENAYIGQPFIEGITMGAEIVEQFKGKKIYIIKYKPKIRYRRRQGHRQNYTRLLVNRIGDVGSEPAAKKTRSTRQAAAASQETAGDNKVSEPVAKKPRAARKSAETSTTAAKKTRSAKKAETGGEA